MKYQIIYIPKIEDEIVIATFITEEEANDWMDHIAQVNPAVLVHHYIKKVDDECVE
tara:strand:+ start:39847 stop:40014 length:168 start_codon:yes stop_codon:yes gene_type:complete